MEPTLGPPSPPPPIVQIKIKIIKSNGYPLDGLGQNEMLETLNYVKNEVHKP